MWTIWDAPSDRDYLEQFAPPEPEEEEEPESMFIARRIEAQSSYEDGGELLCGKCGGICFRHFLQDGQIDVGECCARKAA